MESPLVVSEVHDGVGVVRVNNPPVNALSPGVPEAILEAVGQFSVAPAVSAIVLIGDGRTFIAGADIGQLKLMAAGELTFDESLQRFLDQLETTTKPLVAAIHGTALGGGLETAMACHFRVALSSAKVGQPEVDLGLIPGAAGSQRLPRLIGILEAAKLCGFGGPIAASAADQLGLLDAVYTDDLLPNAVAFAREVASSPERFRPVCDRGERLTLTAEESTSLQELSTELIHARPGQLAPLLAVEAVAAAQTLTFQDGCQQELRLFDRCMNGHQSKAMIRAFFASRRLEAKPATKIAPVNLEQAVIIGTSQATQDWQAHLKSRSIRVNQPTLESYLEPSNDDPTDPFQLLMVESTIFDRAPIEQSQSLADKAAQAGATVAVLATEATLHEPATLSKLNWPRLFWSTGANPSLVETVPPAGDDRQAYDQLLGQARNLGLGFVEVQNGTRPLTTQLVEAFQAGWRFAQEQGVDAVAMSKALLAHGFCQQRCQRWLDGFDGSTLTDQTRRAAASESPESLAPLQILLDALALVSAQILQAGSLANAEQIDMLAIRVLGFPKQLGGPLWWAEQTGIAQLNSRLNAYQKQNANLWYDASLLPDWVTAGSFSGTDHA